MFGGARALVGRNPVRSTLVAAMIVVAVLAGILGFEMPARAIPAEAQAQTPDASDAAQPSPDTSRLLRKAEREGSVRVIVGLRTDFVPEGRLTRSRIADQREAIDDTRAGLRTDLAGTGYRTLREYNSVPYVALTVPPKALRALQRSPLVTSITEDVAFSPALAQSTARIQATTMQSRGHTGAGQTIAVLDTGVDGTHPFLAGKVVEEACYSEEENCPNGQATMTGPGAGVPCRYDLGACEHGTHVAGIAAGQDPGGVGFSGVARGANIMSVQVFSETDTGCDSGKASCARSFTSDQIAGLERVLAVRNAHNIAAVNMSLGGGEYTEACDSEFPAMKAAMNNLYSVGIATVVASGNDGYKNAVAAPACISTATAVGATTNADKVSSFSNVGAPLSFFAPGGDGDANGINSSIPGGGYAPKSGTSMAAPHVAGAFAILKQMNPQSSLLDITRRFVHGGKAVTDDRPGGVHTRRRIALADSFVFTVNSTDNADNGCDAEECTLYGAIAAANTMVNFAEPDVIRFNIPDDPDVPGNEVKTIELNNQPGDLPPLMDPVVIDGYTQPGASANTNPLNAGSNAQPLIELRLKSSPQAGLVVQTDDSTIRGLAINRVFDLDWHHSNGAAISIIGSNNVVEGNHLGTDPAGNAVGSREGFVYGVAISRYSFDNTIGGTAPAARNVISHNHIAGVQVKGDGTVIQGNYIGTNAAGTAAVGDADRRQEHGVSVECTVDYAGPPPQTEYSDCAEGTTIGGNLISGNGQTGIYIRGDLFGTNTTNGTIRGNLIGTQRNGVSPLGNGNDGISIQNGSNWQIGGLGELQANTVAFNRVAGVSVDGPNNLRAGGDGNNISGNSIHSNRFLGINLGSTESRKPARNEPDSFRDSDEGPNEGQNYPVLTSAPVSDGNATVSGTLNSTADTTFRLEFFASAACDESGTHGEGQTYIGTTSVTTDPNGNASFGPLTFRVPSGRSVITSTATDPDGNTSEFSACLIPPSATDDSYTTDQDQPLDVAAPGVLANDTGLAYAYDNTLNGYAGGFRPYPDDKPLTAVKFSDPSNGTLSLNEDGSFSYTPDAGFSGTDSFAYRVNDGTYDSDLATVNLTVRSEPPPQLTAPGDQESYEGREKLFDLGSFADPGTGSPWQVSVDWGDGSEDTAFTANSPGPLARKAHTYASMDSDPSTPEKDPYAVTVTVSEGGTNPTSDTETFNITVNEDPAPELHDVNDQWAYENQEWYFFLGSFFDPGTGTPYTVTVDWGDGSTETFADEPYFDSHPWFYLDGHTHTYANTDSDPSTPEKDPYAVTVTVSEGDANETSETATFQVEVLQAPPETQGDTYSVDEERPLSVDAPGVLENDTDPQEDNLTAELLNPPSNGTLDLRPDGSFTYTPNANFSMGHDFAYYRACDPGGSCSGWTFIEFINEGPAANGDNASTDEDTAVGVNVLENDAVRYNRGNLQPSSVRVLTQPGHGGATVDQASGRITYSPNADYNGADELTYEVCDEGASFDGGDPDPKCDSAKVNVTVNPVNDPPDAKDDAATTDADTPAVIRVRNNDTPGPANEVGQTLTVDAITSPPAHGTAEIVASGPDAGEVRYSPTAGYSGPDSFGYRVCDGEVPTLCDTATVRVTVSPASPVNNAPTARADGYEVDEDRTLTVAAPGILGNDTDADNDPLTAERVSGPAHGTVELRPDGSFTYTPTADIDGEDSFTYRACDDADPRACSDPVAVTITVNPINDAPTADDDTYSTGEDETLTVGAAEGVLNGDNDADGDPLTVELVQGPPAGAGKLTLRPAGSFDFVPAQDFNGPVTFTYKACDNADPRACSAPATVTIDVTARNDAPVARADGYAVDEGGTLTVQAPGVLGNDTDPEEDALTALRVSGPANGTLTLNSNGSFTYAPNAGFSGPDTFTYKANDGQADSNAATVTINVQRRPDTTLPTVFSVNPRENQTGVLRTTNITITFSEAMDTNSLNTNTVKLVKAGSPPAPVPFTMRTSTDGSGRTVLTLDPFGPTTQKLAKAKTYQVTVEGTNPAGDTFAVEDLADNGMANDKVWSFKTKRN
jgi:hypothetical protein